MKTTHKFNNFKQISHRANYAATAGSSARSLVILGSFKTPGHLLKISTSFQENRSRLVQFINFYSLNRDEIIKKYKKYNLNHKKISTCRFPTNHASFSSTGRAAASTFAPFSCAKIRALSLRYLFYRKGFIELIKSKLTSRYSTAMHRRSRLSLPGLMEQVFRHTSATISCVRVSCFKRQAFIILKKMRLWGRILRNYIAEHCFGLTKNSVWRAIAALPTGAMRNFPACFNAESVEHINNVFSSSVALVNVVGTMVTRNSSIFYQKAFDSLLLRHFVGASLPVNREFSPFSGIQKQIINLWKVVLLLRKLCDLICEESYKFVFSHSVDFRRLLRKRLGTKVVVTLNMYLKLINNFPLHDNTLIENFFNTRIFFKEPYRHGFKAPACEISKF